VPLSEWLADGARDFVADILSTERARSRELFDNRRALAGLDREQRFGRKLWGLLSLELWQRQFHDREAKFKGLLSEGAPRGVGVTSLRAVARSRD
jgi:asparagine synthase (glutamine-hydrolysing)